MGYKLKRIMMRPNGVEKQVRPPLKPIDTPGIYHNSDLGLISLSSDGSNWLTIADKNLGATQVYNDGDTLSEANCGKCHQWGNNYGFPFTGSVATSSTQVNTSSYGPNNYYSASTFIKGNTDWSSSQNNNLRGDTTNTLIARRGPCEIGYHVPTETERENIINIGITLGAWTTNGGNSIKSCLKIPFAGIREYSSSNTNNQGSNIYYWTSSPQSARSYRIRIAPSEISRGNGANRAYGFFIRPFKNDSIQPDSSWDKLYPSDLMSFAEIKALAESDATACINELNSNPQGYYQKFTSEGKLYNTGTWYILSSNGQFSGNITTPSGYYIIYKSELSSWQEDV